MLPTLASEGIKVFKVVRGKDESNVSGKGFIAYGLLDHRQKVTIFWRTDVCVTSKVKVASIAHYDSMKDFLDIHVNSHLNGNDTELIFVEFKE